MSVIFPSKKDLSYVDFRNCEIKDFISYQKKKFYTRSKGNDDKTILTILNVAFM